MPNHQQALTDLHDQLMKTSQALDAWQTVITQHPEVLGAEQSQDIQDEIDIKRFGIELDLLIVRARLSKAKK